MTEKENRRFHNHCVRLYTYDLIAPRVLEKFRTTLCDRRIILEKRKNHIITTAFERTKCSMRARFHCIFSDCYYIFRMSSCSFHPANDILVSADLKSTRNKMVINHFKLHGPRAHNNI